MSHYTVLVIGEDIDDRLAPFHEYECTGNNDEYVQDIDVLDELRGDYDDGTRKMVMMENGDLEPLYSDQFKVETDDKPFPRTEYHPPEGLEAREVPYSELMTFVEFVESYRDMPVLKHDEDPDTDGIHQWQYAKLNEQGDDIAVAVRRTNPDARWDWWVLGGRWTGMFKLKSGSDGIVGRPGVFGNKGDDGWVDQAKKGDIDWEGMKQVHFEKASKLYDKYEEMVSQPPDTELMKGPIEWWENNQYPNKEYRPLSHDGYDSYETYIKDQWQVKCAKEVGILSVLGGSSVPSREQYIGEQCAFSTYSVLDENGEWHEAGKMGWWGISHASDDDEEEFRDGFFDKFIDPLDDDTLLSVVDCHI